LIDSKVKTVLDSSVDLAEIGDLTVKGLSRPIRVFDVRGLTASPG
jgi:hypothetical protein